jgi:hypothetical protein
MRIRWSTVILVILGLLAVARVDAACPAAAGTTVVDLKPYPDISASAPACGSITQLGTFVTSPLDPNYWMAVFQIDLTGCTGVCFDLRYNKPPEGWTVNIGDSPNNNGYGGGGSGDSRAVAEVQILGDRMEVFSTAIEFGVVDRLLRVPRQTRICIGDNMVSWGDGPSLLETLNSTLLFQLPDNTASSCVNDDGGTTEWSIGDGNRTIFVGLNRVVSGPGDRTGAGLACVGITPY